MSKKHHYSVDGKTYRETYWSLRNVLLSPLIVPVNAVLWALIVAAKFLTQTLEAIADHTPKLKAKYTDVTVTKAKP